MLAKSLSEWADLLGGQLLPGTDPSRVPTEVGMNTQHLSASGLFVALTGGQRDGHDFAQQTTLALVERSLPVHGIQVDSTQRALLEMGRIHRAALDAPVVAITGSMGKTTTRRMLAAIFERAFGSVLATQGNLNNHLGVPLTLSRLTREQQAVLELGANHQGEIAQLVALAQPDIAAITLAGRAHVEGFGGLAGVVKGKGEIIDGLGHDGVAVLNADDAAFATWLARAGERRVLSFGFAPHADVRALDANAPSFVLQVGGIQQSVSLQLTGHYQITNALCAAACAVAAGIDLPTIVAGLESLAPEAGRGAERALAGQWLLIDDSYNANPDAMKAALEGLSTRPGRRLAVLGEMFELGDEADAAHREVGQYAAQLDVELATLDARYAQGFGQGAEVFSDMAALQEWLGQQNGPGCMLVKGSRGARMERAFAPLIEDES